MTVPLPADRIPDAGVFQPHHLYVGLLMVMLAAGVVWDDRREREPVAVVTAAISAGFAFALVWPTYPRVGWVGTLTFLAVGLCAVVWRRDYWAGVGPRMRYVVALGFLVALDDAVSHALGLPTPLDRWVWRDLLLPFIEGVVQG